MGADNPLLKHLAALDNKVETANAELAALPPDHPSYPERRKRRLELKRNVANLTKRIFHLRQMRLFDGKY